MKTLLKVSGRLGLALGMLLWTYQGFSQNTCASPAVIPSVPFSSGAQTTCGTGNDYVAGFSCVSTNYGGGEDYVYSISITGAPVTYTLALGGAATWKIASVHSACSPTTGNCIGGVATSSGTSASANVTFPSDGTYYIIVDTWPDPTCGGFTLDLTVPPPPPANDNCSGAIAFPTIPTNGTCATLMGNTASATQSQAACAGSGADDDVWFSFVAPATTIIVELTAISGNTDRVHQIFSGSCGSLTSVKCSDPETSTTTGLVVGNTYYIRVHTYGTGSSTSFNICLKTPPPPPANDDCANATQLTVNADLSCGVVTPGTVASATGTADATCTGTEDDDVWFKFTATATSHKIDLLNVTGSTTDLAHQVLSACGGTNLLCSDPNSSTVSGLTVGAEYLLRVYSYTSTTGQTTTFNVCIGTNPPPPANDECAGAIALTVGSSCSFTQYTTSGATGSVGPPAPGCASYSGGDVWFSVVVPSTGRIILDTNTGVVTDGGMAIYSGNCGTLTLIECDDDDSANGLMPFIDRSGLTPGSTVYVRFWEYGNDNPGTFSICAWAPAPPCEAPGAPSASSVGSTSATVSWAAAPGATSYRISAGTAGHVCGTGSITTSGTSINLTGLIPNTTYTFCVRTEACGGGSSSSYVTTTFTTAPLPNDNCAGAQVVTCGTTTAGSTVGAASDSGVGSCGIGSGGTPGNGVWYKFVGNGAQATISLCGSSYDTKLHVYSGACGSLTCVTSSDDFCGSGSQVVFNATVGVDYYILVSGFSSATGAFTMNISCLCGPVIGAPWTTTGVGGATGSAIDNVCENTLDVGSNGFSPSLSADMMNFIHQNLCGNQSVTVKVKNITNGGWAGIMFRESTAAGAKMVAIKTQLNTHVTRDARTTTNGIRSTQQIPAIGHTWLRLVRNGNIFTGFQSQNGVTWQTAFTVTVAMNSCLEVGLFTQGINVNSVATASFSNVSGIPTTIIPLVGAGGVQLDVAPLEFSLFPNPTQSEINVKMGEEFMGKDVTVQIMNQLGQTVMVRRLNEVQNPVENIRLDNFAEGVYFLTLRTEGQEALTKKFIVKGLRP